MKTITNHVFTMLTHFMFTSWMLGWTHLANAQSSSISVADAPREIVEAVHGSAFVGSGSFISNAPADSVFGCSHEAWFFVHEAVVHHASGDVLRVFVDCLKSDPSAGFGPMPHQPGSAADQWGNSFKLVAGKTYHVVVIPMSKPAPYLLLDKLIPDDDWPLFRQDILDAQAGKYIWRDPAVIKERAWHSAVEYSERLYQQMKSGSVARAEWKASADRAARLFDEYKAIRGTNTAIRCP